jgi:hypothetical protein
MPVILIFQCGHTAIPLLILKCMPPPGSPLEPQEMAPSTCASAATLQHIPDASPTGSRAVAAYPPEEDCGSDEHQTVVDDQSPSEREVVVVPSSEDLSSRRTGTLAIGGYWNRCLRWMPAEEYWENRPRRKLLFMYHPAGYRAPHYLTVTSP